MESRMRKYELIVVGELDGDNLTSKRQTYDHHVLGGWLDEMVSAMHALGYTFVWSGIDTYVEEEEDETTEV